MLSGLVEKEEHRKAFIEFMTEALNTLMEDLDCRDSGSGTAGRRTSISADARSPRPVGPIADQRECKTRDQVGRTLSLFR